MDIAQHYTFKQSNLVKNGYMDKEGSCFGLSVDWLRFNNKYQNKNYLQDKYYKKAFTVEKQVNGIKVSFDEFNSNNFYNRINYYSEMQQNFYNNKYGLKASYNFLFNKEAIADSGIILLSSSYCFTYRDDLFKSKVKAHACAYKINKTGQGFNYKYFDPNFGESVSINYPTREMAITNLHYKISTDMSSNYFSIYKDFIFSKNSDQFINDMHSWWKKDKPSISSKGTGKNSLTHKEIKEFVEGKLTNLISDYKNVFFLKIGSCLDQVQPNEVHVSEAIDHALDYYN
ncbi:MAG: hypothetical protein J0H68_01635 [Sphingobacteriia bacterium]|nr:hypothetical protein [Sphingobacteriia bacterium]